MLTDVQIAVLGGDARQLEIIRKLTELDARLSLVGFEQLDHAFSGAVKEKLEDVQWENLDAVILPVPGTNPEGKIDSIFSNEVIYLAEELVKRTPEHCIYFSGISNPFLDKVMTESKRELIQLFDRDDVAIYNSIPTVEGTIMMAIQHTDFTIHGSNTVVLGLGRVGMSVARTFHHLGGKVSVGTRSSEDIARAVEMGLNGFSLEELKEKVKHTDLLINTIPALVVRPEIIAHLPSHALIIDLASKPGGTDFRYAEKRGIKALLAPGLPGIVAPKTAGLILANVLAQLLKEKREEKKS